jgi:TRAP-type C4-dicarboxylate transport system permease small subunit
MNLLVKFLSSIDRAFAAIVSSLLAIILLVMVLLGASQVLLRDLFSGGITWSDVAARNMVLWVAFLGAILATRKRQHIAIDVISRFIPSAPRNIVRIFLDVFSCIVAFYLAKAAYMFVLSEKMMGDVAFANVPTWVVQTIIPFGFIVISLQYAIGVLLDVWRLAHPEQESAEGGAR